jgi:hypothetical protein
MAMPTPLERFQSPLRELFQFDCQVCSNEITADVLKYTAKQGVSEQEALEKGMEEKSREFTEKGSALYAKA